VNKIIDIKAFDLQKTIDMDAEFLKMDAEHQHDKSIQSVGIVIIGEFLPDKWGKFINKLLGTRGSDIFRSKGILAFVGDDQKYVF